MNASYIPASRMEIKIPMTDFNEMEMYVILAHQILKITNQKLKGNKEQQ